MNTLADPNKIASDARADRLKTWIDTHYENQQSFIDKFDLNQGEISNIIQKKRVIGERKARKLESQTDIPTMYLDGLGTSQTQQQTQSNGIQRQIQSISNEVMAQFVALTADGQVVENPDPTEYIFVPKYNVIGSCGDGYVNEHHFTESGLMFRLDWMKSKGIPTLSGKTAIIESDGYSMWPTIEPCSVLLIDLTDTDPQRLINHKVYALLDGEVIRIKRVLNDLVSGKLTLASDNPDKNVYRDEVIEKEDLNRLVILGRVRWRGGDI